jgi:uncharacterized membrane protein
MIIMKKMQRIVGWGVLWLLMAFLCVSLLWTPKQWARDLVEEENVIWSFTPSDVVFTNACVVDENGNVTITEEDSQMVLDRKELSGAAVVIQFANPIPCDIIGQMYLDYGDGFSEYGTVYGSALAGSKTLCFTLQTTEPFMQIRIDIDQNYTFENIVVCRDTPAKIYYGRVHGKRYFALGLVTATLLTGVLWLLDRKFYLFEKLFGWMGTKKKAFIRLLLCIAVLCLLSSLIALIVCHGQMNWALAAFVGTSIGAVLCMFFGFADMEQKPEKTFAGLLFLCGLAMILVSPFGHTSWDEDTHYRWALADSAIGSVGVTEADFSVISNDPAFYEKTGTYSGNLAKIAAYNEQYQGNVEARSENFHLSHVLYGIAIALLRMGGCSFYWVYTLGKLPALILYTILCYFGMKRLKSGKMILAVIAMFPTTIFLAANYSYDYWVTGFSILGMAYFVGMCQEKEQYAGVKDTLVMCASFALACYPKEIYIAFLLIPFFMKGHKLLNKKKYYIICVTAFVILMAFLISRVLLETGGAGDARGGEGVDPAGQIAYILSNFGDFVGMLLRFLKDYLSVGKMTLYMSNFAYLGIAGGSGVIILLLFFVAATDKGECDVAAYSVWVRIYTVLMYVGTAALIAVSMYIAYTPVGTDGVAGAQPRYLIPLIYPLAAVIFGKGVWHPRKKRWYYIGILAVMTVVNMYATATVMLNKMM